MVGQREEVGPWAWMISHCGSWLVKFHQSKKKYKIKTFYFIFFLNDPKKRKKKKSGKENGKVCIEKTWGWVLLMLRNESSHSHSLFQSSFFQTSCRISSPFSLFIFYFLFFSIYIKNIFLFQSYKAMGSSSTTVLFLVTASYSICIQSFIYLYLGLNNYIACEFEVFCSLYGSFIDVLNSFLIFNFGELITKGLFGTQFKLFCFMLFRFNEYSTFVFGR